MLKLLDQFKSEIICKGLSFLDVTPFELIDPSRIGPLKFGCIGPRIYVRSCLISIDGKEGEGFMARLPLVDIEKVTDPEILGIFAWVTEMEGKVPNHFAVELNFPELMKSKLGFTKTLWETGELSMEEIQHVGIVVSRANGCPYCTGAFCTILVHGLGEDKSKAKELVSKGSSALVSKSRLNLITEFAEKVNNNPREITDEDIKTLQGTGLTDKGTIQLIHLVSDFASYNRLNLALDTDYDYDSFGFGEP